MTPPNTSLSERSRLAERAWVIINHLIVIGMLICAAVPAVRIGERLAPGWDGRYLLVVAGLVTLEAMLSERVVRLRSARSPQPLVYRLAEVVVILTALKLAQYLPSGLGQLWADAGRWAADAGSFLDAEYLFGACLVLIVWILAGMFAGALLTMEGDERLFQRELDPHISVERAEARRQLRSSVFTLGAGVMFLTALLRADLAFAQVPAPPLNSGLLNLLLYFLLGLLLLSQSQFAILRAQWGRERIAIRSRMAWRWAGYSLILLLAVTALAGLLPTRYSVGLLDLLGGLVSVVMGLIYLLVFLVTLPLGLLMSWISQLFGLKALPPPTPPTPPTPLAAPPPGVPLSEWIRSLIFWALFLAVVGYSLYYFLRQRPEVVNALRRLPGWSWLVRRLRELGGSFQRLGQATVELVQAGLQRLRSQAAAAAPLRYLSLRRLSPRDQVRFYYRALLRRSRESGLARRPAQTPFEYERDLKRALPDEAGPLESLTGAFVEAEYSRHAVSAEGARSVRAWWDAIRQALRARRP